MNALYDRLVEEMVKAGVIDWGTEPNGKKIYHLNPDILDEAFHLALVAKATSKPDETMNPKMGTFVSYTMIARDKLLKQGLKE